jgi:hypothetical protein
MDQRERELLTDVVFSKGWKVVEKVFANRIERHKAALETCAPEELQDLQSKLDEARSILVEIVKESRRNKVKEDKDV